jgi:PAS domain S-box-containing protein
MVLIYVAGLLAAVAAFGLSIAFLNDFDIVYRVLLSLLPPDDVVAHAPLLDYILGKQRSGGRGGMSAVQGIVQRSPDGIVLASPQGIIDYVNPALSAILGYCPEDLLGQPLARVFDNEMNAQLALLQERQLSGEMHERTILCRTSDDARTVLCNVVMIGMCDADKELSDLVLIVRTMSRGITSARSSRRRRGRRARHCSSRSSRDRSFETRGRDRSHIHRPDRVDHVHRHYQVQSVLEGARPRADCRHTRRNLRVV